MAPFTHTLNPPLALDDTGINWYYYNRPGAEKVCKGTHVNEPESMRDRRRATPRCRVGGLRPFRLGLCLLLAAVVLVAAGCSDAGEPFRPVAGLEAVPAGYALEIEARGGNGPPGSGADRTLKAVVIPQAGLFRIELFGKTSPAEMLITVRTPESQLGYRGQAILDGQPHPLSMGFLDSPLTYPSKEERLDDLTWDGYRCRGVLRRGSDRKEDAAIYEAQIDPNTGIVTWEKQGWTPYAEWTEITRRLVPIASVQKPTADDVLARGREDFGVSTVNPADREIPRVVFDTPMPLPSGADFGGALSRDYWMYGA